MRIAVIADTHDRYPPGLPGLLAGADEIWHLGDVCDPGVLLEFEKLRRPIYVVQGNNDCCPDWPHSLTLKREGLRFHLVHVPPRRPPLHCDVLVHGHTHVPRNETLGSVQWLNPGCITRPSRGWGPSFAWLRLDRGHPIQWEVVKLT